MAFRDRKLAKVLSSKQDLEAFDEFVAKMAVGSGGPSDSAGNGPGLGNIHQTVEWGLFQAKSAIRDKSWVIGVYDGEELVAGAMVIKQKLPLGRCWLYVPRGPIWMEESDLGAILKVIRGIAVLEKAVFLRVDPAVVTNPVNESGDGLQKLPMGDKSLRAQTLQEGWEEIAGQLKRAGFRLAHAHYQPENTLMVDLSQSEEEILAQMKPKGRYNIKLAEKKGVKVMAPGGKSEIRISNDEGMTLAEGVGKFYGLLSETTSRDGFLGHEEKYYLNMLEGLGPTLCKLYLAEYQGEIIAGIIVTFFGDMAIYYFGASGNLHRNVMAPYLLQWVAMREAKARGIRWYDFLGIAPLDMNGEVDEKHAWAGVTEFKRKFGGVVVNYLPARELIYDWPMFLALRLKKWLNGLLRTGH